MKLEVEINGLPCRSDHLIFFFAIVSKAIYRIDKNEQIH